MQPSRLTPGCHHPGPLRAGSQPCRCEAAYPIAPEIRKQIEPNASGRQTRRSYSGFVSAVCIAANVVTLKNNVPADWTPAAHSAERAAASESQTCIAPPAVKKIDPTKNVTASAPG